LQKWHPTAIIRAVQSPEGGIDLHPKDEGGFGCLVAALIFRLLGT